MLKLLPAGTRSAGPVAKNWVIEGPFTPQAVLSDNTDTLAPYAPAEAKLTRPLASRLKAPNPPTPDPGAFSVANSPFMSVALAGMVMVTSRRRAPAESLM